MSAPESKQSGGLSLPLFAIRRHVLTATLSLVLLLMGVVAYFQLSLDRMPKISIPALTVVTTLPGADPDTVAKSITTPIESQLNTISGLDTLSSISGQGVSNITLSFTADKDMQEALTDVQSKLERVRRTLPEDAESPQVIKIDMNAEPIIQLILTSPTVDIPALTVAAKQVQKRLEGLMGVGEVRLSGVQEEILEVALRDAALTAYGLTVGDVLSAIKANHLQPAAGKARLPTRDYAMRLAFEAVDPESLASITVGTKDGAAIRLRDVADVVRTQDKARQVARFNGVPGVAISITKAEEANPVTVVDLVQERVAELQGSLPEGVSLTVASEEAKPIRDLVQALADHLIEGTILTALVIWLFLKNLRATVIVAVAIPVSLLGAVAAFQWLGYTLNSFTLLALLLLIGIVVDDAIVVLENIYRVQETEGLSGEQAAAKGSEEVLFSVAAATLTLVAIFGPIMYLDGVIGQIFQPFAAVVTVGVMVSWFVAVTLTPMLCAKFLRHESHPGKASVWLETQFRRLETGYRNSLSWSLSHGRLVMIGAFATMIPAFFILQSLEKGFIPSQDTGRLSVRVELAAGMPSEQIDAKLKRVEELLQAEPDVATVLMTYREAGRTGAPAASAALTLVEERTKDQMTVINDLNRVLATVDGVRATASAPASGGGGAALQFSLVGPSMDVVAAAGEQLMQALRKEPITASVRSNLDLASPQITVTLDREAAGLRGVSAQDVGRVVSAGTGELVAGYYTGLDGERHSIKLTTERKDTLENLDDLLAMTVRGAQGQRVPLSEVVIVRTEGAASAVTRESQQYAVRFFGEPNGALGDATAIIEEAAKRLPEGTYLLYSGQAKEFKKMGKSLGLVLLAALLLLYLVMASQFNGYKQPGVIMLAQPLAALGGLGALWAVGHSLNIYSMVGLVLLVGLTAKTGILLVDRANQMQAKGLSPQDAMLHAAPERLRPVLMTALTVVASLFPAALGLGAGSEYNGPLAVAVIGGMISATALTLYVIPIAYLKMGSAQP